MAVNGTDNGAPDVGSLVPPPTGDAPSSGSSRRRPADRNEHALVAVVVVVGAIMAMLVSDAAPTATTWIDALERGLFVAVVASAASRARRWALVLGSVFVTLAAPWPLLLLGIACLGVSVLQVETRTRNRTVGAVTGATVALVSLGLSVPGPTGIETVLAVAATAPIMASGYRRAMPGARRSVRRAALALLIVLAVSLVVTVIAGVMASGRVDSAIELTNRAVDAAESGAGSESAALFAEANDAFDAANATIGSPWASVPRLLPVVGANLAAIQRAVGAGVDLSEAGANLVSGAEFEEVQLDDGGVDLMALDALAPRVIQAADVLGDAQATIASAGSVWLLAPLAERLSQVDERLGITANNADNAAVAVEGLPAMLGADGARRYLFLFGNPAESRDMGGHIGNWAEVVADNGRIDLVEVGGPLDLSMPEVSEELSEGLPASFATMDPARFPQNLGATPDLGMASGFAAGLFDARFDRPVDGVVYADTEAFAALVGLTGPVAVPGLDGYELTEDNAVQFLTHDQYVLFDSEEVSSAALEEVIRTVFDRLTSTKLASPDRLGAVFSPLVRNGHFRLQSLHDDDGDMLEHFGLPRELPEPDGGDVLAVLNRNAGPSKIDSYLTRQTRVAIDWDPRTGTVDSVASVRLRNSAPEGGVNPIIGGSRTVAAPGSNVTDLTVLTPFLVERVTVDGVGQAPQSLLEDGLWRHSVRVAVPPGGNTDVVFDLGGRVDPGPEYRLMWLGQPLVNPGEVLVDMRPTSGNLAEAEAEDAVSGRGTTRLSQEADAVVQWRAEGDR